MAKEVKDHSKPLTPKQERFCEEYLIDLNATQAAIRAGYSENTATEQASRLLTNVNIQKYIKDKQEEVRNRNAITIDFVVNGIKDIATQGENEGNRLKAFDLLGKHLGIYEKDNTQSKPEAYTVITRNYVE